MPAPSFVDYGVSTNAGFTATDTYVIDAGSNSGRVVVVLASTDRPGAQVVSATCNGNAMTALFGNQLSITATFYYRGFILAGDGNIAAGENTIVVTYDTDGNKPFGFAVLYKDVDGTTPSGTAVPTSYNASGGYPITSASGETVVAITLLYEKNTTGQALDADSPAVERVDVGGIGVLGAGAHVMDTAGGVSGSIDVTQTNAGEWAGLAIALKPSAGAAVPYAALMGTTTTIGGAVR
jgi:hypothetical protein